MNCRENMNESRGEHEVYQVNSFSQKNRTPEMAFFSLSTLYLDKVYQSKVYFKIYDIFCWYFIKVKLIFTA